MRIPIPRLEACCIFYPSANCCCDSLTSVHTYVRSFEIAVCFCVFELSDSRFPFLVRAPKVQQYSDGLVRCRLSRGRRISPPMKHLTWTGHHPSRVYKGFLLL